MKSFWMATANSQVSNEEDSTYDVLYMPSVLQILFH